MFHVGAAAAANRAVTPSPTLVACGTAPFAPAGAPTWAWRLLADIRAMFHVGAAAAANRAVTPSPTLAACGTAPFAPAGAPTWAWRLLGRHPHDVLCRSGGSREQGGHALTDAGRVRHRRFRACRRSYISRWLLGGCAAILRRFPVSTRRRRVRRQQVGDAVVDQVADRADGDRVVEDLVCVHRGAERTHAG